MLARGDRKVQIAALVDLFAAFFRASILSYGGGPSAIPLIEAEVVDRYQWLTSAEFAQALAIANSLPGPIATKLGGFVGYQVARWPGALAALVATVAPTVLLMIVLYGALSRLSGSPVIQGMIAGIRPVVWVLFVMLALDYLAFVRSVPSAAIALLAFVAVYLFKWHPAIVVLFGLIAGGLFLRPQG